MCSVVGCNCIVLAVFIVRVTDCSSLNTAIYTSRLHHLPHTLRPEPLPSFTRKMKQNSLVFIIFTLFLFLLYSHSGSARLLATKQDEQVVMGDWMTRAGSSKEEDVDMLNLMGLEKCHENDEECLKRRMVAEAHLDYIYTQHHKP